MPKSEKRAKVTLRAQREDGAIKAAAIANLVAYTLCLTPQAPLKRLVDVKHRTKLDKLTIVVLSHVDSCAWAEHFAPRWQGHDIVDVKWNASRRLIEPILPTILTFESAKAIDAKLEQNVHDTCVTLDKLLLRDEERDAHGYPGLDAVETSGYLCLPSLQAEEEVQVPSAKRHKGDELAQLVAIDCEMCRVEGGALALARVTCCDSSESVIFDTLVKPDKPIVDYLTPYSGITLEMLQGVDTTLQDVWKQLTQHFTAQTIFVGHSLENDLHALKMYHKRCIDTAVMFADQGGYKKKLQLLTKDHLGLEIQQNADGHDSQEDAIACLRLVKHAVSKGIQKDSRLSCNILGGVQRWCDANGRKDYPMVIGPPQFCKFVSRSGCNCVPSHSSQAGIQRMQKTEKPRLSVINLGFDLPWLEAEATELYAKSAEFLAQVLETKAANECVLVVGEGNRIPLERCRAVYRKTGKNPDGVCYEDLVKATRLGCFTVFS